MVLYFFNSMITCFVNVIYIDPDSEVVVFAKRTVKDLKLPPAFITQIASSIQVNEFTFLYMHLLGWPLFLT